MNYNSDNNNASLVWKVELMSDQYSKNELDTALLNCTRLMSTAMWSILESNVSEMLAGQIGENFKMRLTTYTEDVSVE